MKQVLYTFLLLAIAHDAISQTNVRYYKSTNLKHEVSQKKARYAYTVADDAGVVTYTLADMQGNIIWKELYKNGEPVGIWQTTKGELLDYNFELEYYTEVDTLMLDVAMDTYPPEYNLESILGDVHFIYNNLRFPQNSTPNERSGVVSVSYTVTKDGSVSNVKCFESVNPMMDKEVVRVARMLRYEEPATYNGRKVLYNLAIPIDFSARYNGKPIGE